MKKFLRPFLMLALLIVACIVLNPTKAYAASTKDLTFKLNSDGASYSVTDCKTYASGSLIIPATYKDKPITGIGSGAFDYCYDLTSVTVPDSVTTIGTCAFDHCFSLTNVNIPEGVTAIQDFTFTQCTSLTDIEIPDSVTFIGGYAFQSCTNLLRITIPDGVTSIGQSAFSSCTSLTSATLPDSITTIGSFAFSSCTNLVSVNIPDSVTTIGEKAFSWCETLTSVTIPAGVTSLGAGVFGGSTSLTRIIVDADNPCYSNDSQGVLFDKNKTTILGVPSAFTAYTTPSGIATIGPCAFFGCTNLKSITISKDVKTVGRAAFSYCTALTQVTIPGTITTLGESVFIWCTSLTTVNIGDGITAITEYLFAECESLTKITIPKSVTSIEQGAFSNCTGLTTISIPGHITSIGNHAFYKCASLTSVTIQDGVAAITRGAFKYCTSLKSITIPDSVTSIGYEAFYGCQSLKKVTIPKNAVLSEEVFAYCSGLTDVVFENGVTTLGYSTFRRCTSLTNVTIPDSVTAIDDSAYGIFGECTGLKSITIPDSVTAIGFRAFDGCTGLKNIIIPDSVATIGVSAFSGCTGLTNIVIPSSVTDIGWEAFYGCTGLKSITLPDSIEEIQSCTFWNCTSLADVYYTGTEAQWNEIEIGDENEPLLNATIHYLGNCAAYGHTVEIIPGKYATATETGLTEGRKCSLCGEILVAQQVIPATGSAHSHQYDHEFDKSCSICGAQRETNGDYEFVNYRVVFSDPDTTHKNLRVEVYKLGDKFVSDPTDDKALRAIDSSYTTYWGASHINKICITDAGSYVLLLKYNVGTGAATKIPMQITVSADPKLIIDKNNKITAVESNAVNINHRVVVYYLGDQTVEDIYDEATLKAIDGEPETVWKLNYINRLALTKGGNYVLHLCYNEGVSAKLTVAQQFTVDSIPTVSVNINNMLVATEENEENRNHRATVFFLGNGVVEDTFDEDAVAAAAVSSKTYWGLSNINKAELKEGGNYVIHLYYNVGTSEKRTLALDVTVNERPVLKVDKTGKITVSYSDSEINNPRAYIYNVGDAELADIYDEAALKAIATPTQVWGLSSINKKTLAPGTYVVHFYYSIGTSAKKTVALKVTI